VQLERATTHRAAVIPIDGGNHGPRLVVERVTAETDNDKVTQQTIRTMARYVRESLKDPLVLSAASQAQRRFGSGSTAPGDARSRRMLDVWGVFWFIKHLVKFQSDDGKALQYPQLAQDSGDWLQDLLVSPSVLLRMQQPKEDCDGFTMLAAAMLAALDIPAYIVTVAADPKEPSRWSHVFAAAVIDGKTIPLDTSHGLYPGWMVPQEHIYRIQAWDLDGAKANLKFPDPRRHTLHGYYRRGAGFAGLGDCTDPTDPSFPCSGPPAAPDVYTCPDGLTIPVGQTCPALVPGDPGYSVPPGTLPSSSSNPLAAILSAISAAGATTRTIAGSIAAPAGYVYNPVTGTYTPATGAYGATIGPGGVVGSLGWLPIAGIALLAIFLIGGRK
jgi:hypothetical protein